MQFLFRKIINFLSFYIYNFSILFEDILMKVNIIHLYLGVLFNTTINNFKSYKLIKNNFFKLFLNLKFEVYYLLFLKSGIDKFKGDLILFLPDSKYLYLNNKNCSDIKNILELYHENNLKIKKLFTEYTDGQISKISFGKKDVTIIFKNLYLLQDDSVKESIKIIDILSKFTKTSEYKNIVIEKNIMDIDDDGDTIFIKEKKSYNIYEDLNKFI